MADGSKAATLVSGRCLYGIASLREELTTDERFAEDIKKTLMNKENATKLVTMSTFLHTKAYRILAD